MKANHEQGLYQFKTGDGEVAGIRMRLGPKGGLSIKNGPDFAFQTFGDRVEIIDLDRGGQSVTNGAEKVIEVVAGLVPELHKKLVVYRDSDGRWDRLLVNEQNEFAGFAPIEANNETEK